MNSVEHFEDVNIAEVCRVCFETCDHYKLLYEQAECIENQTLGDLFYDVVKIEMDTHAETLPSRICITCLDDLINAYSFIQKSHKSNQRLIQILKNADIKPTELSTDIKVDDVSDEQNIMDDGQIKIENETLDDYNDFMGMEFKNSPVNSYDSDLSDCDSLGNKYPKLECQYCDLIFKKQHLYENHLRTHLEEDDNTKKGDSEDGNKLECYECDFSCDSYLDMEKHQQSKHTTRRARRRNIRRIGRHTEEQMKNAIKQITDGISIRAAAKNESLKYATVRRYWNKIQLGDTRLVPNYNINRVFTDEQEESLKFYILQCTRMFYCLKSKDVRKLAYDLANKYKIVIPNSWCRDQLAGLEWFRSFRQRHKDISPDAFNLTKTTAFDKSNFCNNLEELYHRSPIFSDGTRVYHLHEILTSTVHKPQKLLDPKGSSSSGKSDNVVNTCCIISAAGNALPPAIVFPQMSVEPSMINTAPFGTLGLANPTGLMTSNLFVEVIKHFIKKSDSSLNNPSILIYDNPEFHYSIEALDYANNAGVAILTLPPQISGKVQPFFAAFKKSYYATCDSWMMRNPDHPPTIGDVAGMIGIAHDKALTPLNIRNSFKMTGLYPFNRDILKGNGFILKKQVKLSEVDYQSLVKESKEAKTKDEHSEVFNEQLQVEYKVSSCTAAQV